MPALVCVESDDHPLSSAAAQSMPQATTHSVGTLQAALHLLHELRPRHATAQGIVQEDVCIILCEAARIHVHTESLAALREAWSGLCTVIVVTPQADYAATRAALQHGADDVVAAPHLREDLPAALQRHEARLRLAEQRMQSHTVQHIQELARNISSSLPHEFRTPLNSLMGFVHLLGERGLPSEEIPSVVEYMDAAVKRLYRTAEKFLLYVDVERSAAASGAGMEGFITFDVASVVHDVATETAMTYHREHDVQLDVQAIRAPVTMRNQYLRFVIMECVTNACKFSPPHTPVVISLAEDGGQAVLTVRDAGHGMTPSQMSRIQAFMQFEREHYEQQGLGLGLTIVRNILALSHGTLSIRSDASGTSVMACIPLRTDAHDGSEQSSTQSILQYATMHPLK